MNKPTLFLVVLLTALAGSSLAAQSKAQSKTAAAGEEFFIISSVDQSKSQIVLKRATEVTQLMKVNDKTQFLDTNNKPIQLADLKAGDTVWAISSPGQNGDLLGTRIRKGSMTIEELHRHFLDYPVIK
jgi:hypothetical protein